MARDRNNNTQPQTQAAAQPAAEETVVAQDQATQDQAQDNAGADTATENTAPAGDATQEQNLGVNDASQGTQEEVQQGAEEEAPAAAAEEEVVQAAPQVQEVKQDVLIDGTDALIQEAVTKVGVSAKLALMSIADYMVAMQPRRPIDNAKGSQQQIALYRAITGIINNTEADFQVAFSTLLNLFHKHRAGVFHEVNVFRFTEHITLNKDETTAFLRLLNLLKLTADPKAREVALRQVRLEDTLAFGINDAGKQRVLEFFGK